MMKMQEWFQALAPRERILVSAAGALFVVAVVVIGGVRPLVTGLKAAETQLTDKRAVLADIEHVAARFGAGAGASAASTRASGESLVVIVDRTTRSHGLGPYLKRNEPDGTDAIRLRFENAPFDELINWLAELQSSQGVSVVSANTDSGEGPGRVSANLQLSRGPSRGKP